MSMSPLDRSIAVIQYPSLVQGLADCIARAIAPLLLPQDSSVKPIHPCISPPDPPILGGESQKLGSFPPRIGGLGGPVQCLGFSSEQYWPMPLFTPSDRTFGTFYSPILLQLSRDDRSLSEAKLCEITILKIWVNPAGWLYAAFSPNDITTWLQSLICAKPVLFSLEPKKLFEQSHASLHSPPSPPTLGGSEPQSPPSLGSHFRGRVPRLEESGADLGGECNVFWASPTLSNSNVSEIAPTISSDPVLFHLQHAHARCHSLLRLAGQEKFLPCEDLAHYFQQYGPSLWQTEGGVLHLQTKAEQALLMALMQFPQSLSPQKVIYGCARLEQRGNETRVLGPLPSQHLYKQAIAWTQLFSDFHRDCRLFGTAHKDAPQVVLARFGLIYIVKNVLAFLLEEIFQITAPLTL